MTEATGYSLVGKKSKCDQDGVILQSDALPGTCQIPVRNAASGSHLSAKTVVQHVAVAVQFA